MSLLPPVTSFILNPEAQTLDLLFVTNSVAMRRRKEWELEPFEVDELGFPNGRGEEEYTLVLHLQGPVDQLDASWLPEALYEEHTPMEPVESRKMRELCLSLARGGQLWLHSDDSRDAGGQLIGGLLGPEARKLKKASKTGPDTVAKAA